MEYKDKLPEPFNRLILIKRGKKEDKQKEEEYRQKQNYASKARRIKVEFVM